MIAQSLWDFQVFWHLQICIRRRALLLLSLSLILVNPVSAEARTGLFTDIKMTADFAPDAGKHGDLRPDAAEISELLEITPYVEQLRQHRINNPADTCDLPKPLLTAKVLCLWKILMASEEVRKFSAKIDLDLATSNVALDALVAKRDATSNAINNANFAQGGLLGITKQSLFLHKYFATSNIPLIVSASIGTTLSVANMFAPNMYRAKIENNPNMLAHFFDADYKPSDASQSHLYKFFHSAIPGGKYQLTRREILVRHWHDFAGLKPDDPLLIRKLSSAPVAGEDLNEDIKLLSLRVALLHDLKTHVEEVDGCLYELHKAIRSN